MRSVRPHKLATVCVLRLEHLAGGNGWGTDPIPKSIGKNLRVCVS